MTEEARKDPALLAAEIAKMQAEARKATAEALKFELEAELTRLSARVAGNEAEINDIRLKRVQYEQKAIEAEDLYHHVYRFTESVTEKTVEACMERLTQWSRIDPGCQIEVIFSSPGGLVIPGMAVFDYVQGLRKAGHHITTGALGYAASMAGILLQAGDVRWMGRESYILVHELTAIALGKMGDIEDEVAFLKLMQSRILSIFASRTKLTKAELARRWKRKDWWMDSTQALKLGFVDEVRG